MDDFKINETTYIRKVDKTDVTFITETVVKYKRFKQLHDKDGQSAMIKLVKDELDLSIFNIIAYGKTDNITNHMLNKFIDSIIVTSKRGDVVVESKACRCYAPKDTKMSDFDKKHSIEGFTYLTMIKHEDLQCSWLCLLTQLDNPKYVIVYKQ